MASPSGTYVPRSIVGALILIVTGGVFLLRNFGYSIPLFHFHYFVIYWPLLLVLVGLVRLTEYFAARRGQRPMPQMGFGTVFLLVVVTVAGVGLSAAFRGREQLNWGSLHDNVEIDDDLMHLFGKEYTYTGEITQQIPAGGSVRVNCDRGNITVNSWDQSTVKVVYQKRIFARSQSEADKTNQSTAPRLHAQGSKVDLQANTEGAGRKGVAANLEIYVPAKANLEVTGRRGDIAVSQRTADVKISSQHGDVTLDQVTGNVNVSTQKGSLRASNLTGSLTVDGRLDDLVVDTVSGTVTITADMFGETQLSKLNRGVVIHTSRTDLQLAKVDGNLTMNASDLQGDGLQGPILLSAKSKDVTLRNFAGDVRINDDQGNINLESTSLALGSLDLTTHHGDVHLRLPAKANFQYQLVTRHGEISSDFEGVRPEGGHGNSSATGTVGRGGVKINITSDAGDIAIFKTEGTPQSQPVMPEPPAKPGKPRRPGKKVGDIDVM